MADEQSISAALPADVHQIDETGYVCSFLSESAEPARVRPGALIVAGDPVEPFLALVVDVINGPGGDSIVHLDFVACRTRRSTSCATLGCCQAEHGASPLGGCRFPPVLVLLRY